MVAVAVMVAVMVMLAVMAMANKRIKDERLRKVQQNYSVSKWVADWLRTQRNASATVEESIIKQNELVEPDRQENDKEP